MKVALFIPCYVQATAPQVGRASLLLLKALGVDAEVPEGQTCCGQPMGNAGFQADAKSLAQRFERIFQDYDVIVGPSSSCVTFVREHYAELTGGSAAGKIYDICEYIHDVVRPSSLPWAKFPHKVSLHNSCHGVRLMHLSAPSELNVPYFNKLQDLLEMVEGIEVVQPERPDECCGFGGLFSVEESAVSVQMGRDKVRRHLATGAEYITAADSSCLMHQGGVAKAMSLPLKTIHIVEILASGLDGDDAPRPGTNL